MTVLTTVCGTRLFPTSVRPSLTHCVPTFSGSHLFVADTGSPKLAGSKRVGSADGEDAPSSSPPHPDVKAPIQSATAATATNSVLRLPNTAWSAS